MTTYRAFNFFVNAKTITLIVVAVLISGCSTVGRGRAKLGSSTVIAPSNALAPSSLLTDSKRVEQEIPAGTKMTLTEMPATAQAPASKVTSFEFFQPSKITTVEDIQTAVIAAPRPPDKSVEIHQQDNAERRLFLYAAAFCGLCCVFFVWRAYPTPALLSGAAGAICVLLWWVAGSPWIMGCCAALVALGAGMYFAHERLDGHLAQHGVILPPSTPKPIITTNTP